MTVNLKPASLSQFRQSAVTRMTTAALAALLLVLMVMANVPVHSVRAAGAAPASVSVLADPTVALARWPAVAGAANYRVSLIRTRDLSVMQQSVVPATQRAFDAQPLFPGEEYEVAVEAQFGDGTYGPYTLSQRFKGRALDHALYGFLDDGNLPAGQINNLLWDRELNVAQDGPWAGAAFTNAQLHYHLSASNPPGSPNYGDQVVVPMTARVPFDFSGRTMTVSGMVDLKGDKHQWFGVALAPQPVGDSGIVDDEDRGYSTVAMPLVELFDIDGQLEVHYAAAGQKPRVLATTPNPIGVNNVRDEVRWQVSATGYSVSLDGQQVMAGNWPAPLAFTTGYMTLFAQNYPGSGGSPQDEAVDGAYAAASIWHLDDWAFDAPAGQQQPQTAVYLPAGCAFYAGAENTYQLGAACGRKIVSGTSSWQVSGVVASDLASAYISLDGYRWDSANALQVRVNNGAWQTPTYQQTGAGNTMKRFIAVPIGDLIDGANTIQVRKSGNNAAGDIPVSNVELVTLAQQPFVPAALPAQPAPLFPWQAGSATVTPSPTATRSPTPSTPSPTATSTPTATATATPTVPPTATPVITGFTPAAHAPVGASILIEGANLSDALSVSFNGTKAGAIMVHGPGEIMVTVPQGATSGPVVVVTPEGTATSPIPFTVDGATTEPIPLDGDQCAIIRDGQFVIGTCDGEFTPAAA